MNTKILYRRDPSMSVCPECGSPKLTKSRARSFKENLAKHFTYYRTYRCKSCGWRGYIGAYKFTKKSFQAILLYVVVITVTFAIATIVMNKVIN